MRVSVTEAKAQLTELVRRAEAGEEIVLTRHGHEAVRLTPVRAGRPDQTSLRKKIKAIQAEAALTMTPGPGAARSQDFLYDDDGLPR